MKGDQIKESSTIEKEKVKLNRIWSFWENYESKDRSIEYSKLIKEIYTFDNIISFWQFWNKYPGNDANKIFFNGEDITFFFKEKFRVISMNLFEKGIRPEWEDEKNKKGKIFSLEYDIKQDLQGFLNEVNKSWVKLISLLIGEQLPASQYINGIRFVDKVKFGKNVLFRFEIWTNSSIETNDIEKLAQFLSDTFGAKAHVKEINKG